MNTVVCYSLEEALSQPATGGKARGLARLKKLGLRVPQSVALVFAEPHFDASLCEQLATEVAGPLAVRSSASDEDGAVLSYAGQFESVLHVEGAKALEEALRRCLDATARAKKYREGFGVNEESKVSLVVQSMVSARCSGVLFTMDPVTGSKEHWTLEVIAGTGEALTAGHARAQSYRLRPDGAVETKEETPLLRAEVLQQLIEDTKKIQEEFGTTLDLEWAVDHEERIWWLQARPVTVSNEHAHEGSEFDSPPPDPQWIFTTYNLREVLPGAATPLSRSIFSHGIQYALVDLFSRAGVPRERLESRPLITQYYGHFFLNLSVLYEMPAWILGPTKEDTDYSIAGRLLPGTAPPLQPMHVRGANLLRYLRVLRNVPEQFERFEREFKVPTFAPLRSEREVQQTLEQLRNGWKQASEAFRVHIANSTLSGASYGFLLGVLSNGKRPADPEHHALASELLRGLADGSAASLSIHHAMEQLAKRIAKEPVSEGFASLPLHEARAHLEAHPSSLLRESYERFLQTHGHRGLRECELQAIDWSEDPTPLVKALQTLVGAPTAREKRAVDVDALLSGVKPAQRWMIERVLVPWTRRGTLLRERSKSLAVKSIRSLKPGYRHLAEHLQKLGRLPETGLVFFFTHEELETLAAREQPALVRKALQRRRKHAQHMLLSFPEVFEGMPVPLKVSQAIDPSEELRGTPVSAGRAVGIARVACTLEEGMNLQAGEVLVVDSTDVGWAPLFPRAAALVTSIGGTLSHGAVVAREFGLPAVVNLPGVTRWARTGDTLEVDGSTGTVRRIARV